MTTEKIKAMLIEIANAGCGIVENDEGSGSGGPGFLDSDSLREYVAGGLFDDAVVVDLEEDLQKDSFEHICDLDSDTDWVQIKYAFGDLGYCRIAWIWEV